MELNEIVEVLKNDNYLRFRKNDYKVYYKGQKIIDLKSTKMYLKEEFLTIPSKGKIPEKLIKSKIDFFECLDNNNITINNFINKIEVPIANLIFPNSKYPKDICINALSDVENDVFKFKNKEEIKNIINDVDSIIYGKYKLNVDYINLDNKALLYQKMCDFQMGLRKYYRMPFAGGKFTFNPISIDYKDLDINKFSSLIKAIKKLVENYNIYQGGEDEKIYQEYLLLDGYKELNKRPELITDGIKLYPLEEELTFSAKQPHKDKNEGRIDNLYFNESNIILMEVKYGSGVISYEKEGIAKHLEDIYYETNLRERLISEYNASMVEREKFNLVTSSFTNESNISYIILCGYDNNIEKEKIINKINVEEKSIINYINKIYREKNIKVYIYLAYSKINDKRIIDNISNIELLMISK